MIFISFFTPDGAYPDLAGKLVASLDRLRLRSDVQMRPRFADWVDGVRFKPRFILDRLLEHRQPVVWLDVDTEVRRHPQLLFGKQDFAIYNWLADKGHHLDGEIPFDRRSTRLMCSGGVQKWGYTAPAIELLLRWNRRVDERTDREWDDPLLDEVFNQHRPPVDTLWLPKTYNRMDGLSEHWSAVPPEQIVINHDYRRGGHRQDS
jgi:hypothetical protein